MDFIAKILAFLSSINIVQIVGYVYIGLQAIRGLLMALKGLLTLIPGDQGEALIDTVTGFIDVIENFLGRLVPAAKK